MKLKVCGLRDRQNITEVLQSKPDYIGFIFYSGSPRYAGDALQPEFAQRISEVKKIGVFVNETEMQILDRVARYGLDLVQLHGDESPEFCAQIRKNVPVIKAFRISEGFDFSSLVVYNEVCNYFLFDADTKVYGGSGKTFNWNKLKEYAGEKPFFLSGGISNGNLDEVLQLASRHPQLFAIDVNSKYEIEPGLKDVTKLNDLKIKMSAHVV